MGTAAHEASEFSRSNVADDTALQFISCCQEELIELELEALRQGGDQAIKDGLEALADVARVADAAACACDRALAERYFALDEAKFREVYILAWCAGYRAQTRAPRPQVTTQPRPDHN